MQQKGDLGEESFYMACRMERTNLTLHGVHRIIKGFPRKHIIGAVKVDKPFVPL